MADEVRGNLKVSVHLEKKVPRSTLKSFSACSPEETSGEGILFQKSFQIEPL